MKNIIELSRKAAGEGAVLLKNDNKVLPLLNNEKIAIFGRCQYDYYKSGTGSGGAVHTPYTTNLIDGLLKHPLSIHQGLLETYKRWIKENPFDNGGGGWAAEPWFQKEMDLEDEYVKTISQQSQKALIVIGRTAGEDQDNADVAGSYRLTDLEKDLLVKVCRHFDKVVVILNVPGIIDMSWDSDRISSILYAWHGGMEAGNGTADVLVGKTNPCGKLTDTIAYKLEDYPSHKNFGHPSENIYEEDIYLGYRYFETFNPQAVKYSFGFGLSYTNFKWQVIKSLIHEDQKIEVQVRVENIGTYPGREVLQLYFSPPQGMLGKPSKALGGFQKTRTLEPGESEVIILSMDLCQMASFDDSGISGHPNTYILEKGLYYFFLGNSLGNLQGLDLNLEPAYLLDHTKVISELSDAMAPRKSFRRIKPGKKNGLIYEVDYETVQGRQAHEDKLLEVKDTCLKTDDFYTLKDVSENKISIDMFVNQLSLEALTTLVKGEGMCSPKGTAGTAAVFGGISQDLQQYKIPVVTCADGPSGIRMDSGQKASQVPIGTALACTWDTKLLEDIYECIGLEMYENKIDVLLGPGLNIHRHPLNGRNFEYFSEDPLITGLMASGVIKGLKKAGVTGTLKHFVANNQEWKRHTVDSVVSQRALREIYLKAFEIPVENGADAIMTAYNPVNGIYTASNYDLNTQILRNEWGFKGIVMTDWWAKMNHPVKGGPGDLYHKSNMIHAQNDLFMVVPHNEANQLDKDDLYAAVAEGQLSKASLVRSAKNICEFILSTQAFKRNKNQSSYQYFKAVNKPRGDNTFKALEITEIDLSRSVDLYIETPKVYKVEITMKYEDSPLAQASFNLMVNNAFAVTVQLSGQEHDWVTREICEVELEKGYYHLDFSFLRPGIELKNIRFYT